MANSAFRKDGQDGTSPAFSGVRVYHSAAQTIADDANTALTFDSERFDTDSFHEGVTNPTRITFPSTAKYMVGGQIAWATPANGGRCRLWILLNGTDIIAYEQRVLTALSGSNALTTSTLWSFTAADYVELLVYQRQSVGANLDVTGNSASNDYTPEFWAYKVG